MAENYFGLIEAVFVIGLAVAFYIWQMRDLTKENEKARRRAEGAAKENEQP